MKGSRVRASQGACALALASAMAMSADTTLQAAVCPFSLSTANYRGSNTPVVSGPHYDYAASVMLDGQYRMWWCSTSGAGDAIHYATSASLDGPWSATTAVFAATGNPGNFDGLHTCDPSVIRVSGTYYMYYGGNVAGGTTRIGLAVSSNGINWVRANGGNAIINPRLQPSDPGFASLPNQYGAGQPSVTHVNGYFYLIYTDSTGIDSNPFNGAGQYVLRSTDPSFQTGVQELVGPGVFAARTTANHTTFALAENFSIDWQYVDMLDAFAIANNGPDPNATQVTFWSPDFTTNYGTISVAGQWREGPAIVSRPDRHAIASPTCGLIPIDIMQPVGVAYNQPFTWNLAHTGLNVLTGLSCACSQMSKVLDGYIVLSPGLPWTIPVGGKRLQFALAGPAQQLSKNYIWVSSEAFHSMPYGASLFPNNPAYYTDAQPWAFLLDDGKLWGGSCYNLFASNGSAPASYMAQSTYGATPKGPGLFCVQ